MIKDWIKCVLIGLFWGGIILVLFTLVWYFFLGAFFSILMNVFDFNSSQQIRLAGWPINLIWPVEIFYIFLFVFLPTSILSKGLNIPFLGAVTGFIGGIFVMFLIPEFGHVYAFDKISFVIMCMCCGIAIDRNVKAQFREEDNTPLVTDS